MLKVIEKVRSFTHKEVDFVINRCSDGAGDDYVYVCSQVRYTYKLGRVVEIEYRKSFSCDYYDTNNELYKRWLSLL